METNASASMDFPRIVELDDDTLAPITTYPDGHPTMHAKPVRADRSKRKTKCPLCNIELLQKTLPRHMRTVHGHRTSSPQCSVCGTCFKRADILERHEREQHGAQSNNVTCDICGAKVCRRALQEHLLSIKCREASAAAISTNDVSTVGRAHSKSVTANFVAQPGPASMLDPLVTAASLHRLALLGQSAAKPYLITVDSTEYWVQPAAFGDEEWYEPIVDLDFLHYMRKTYRVTTLQILELRDLVLNQTRQILDLLKQSDAWETSLEYFHDCIIRFTLLNAADRIIFGNGSLEHIHHTRGLASILKSVEITPEFVARFHDLYQHTWCSTHGSCGWDSPSCACSSAFLGRNDGNGIQVNATDHSASDLWQKNPPPSGICCYIVDPEKWDVDDWEQSLMVPEQVEFGDSVGGIQSFQSVFQQP